MRPAADPTFFSTGQAPRGVVLAAHGMNTRPSVMLPLINWLRENGCEAFLLKLYGHHAGSGSFSEMQEGQWQEDLEAAYHEAQVRARELNVPLYFLGFSLGALVSQHARFRQPKKISFDKQVLLAPAIALRRRSFLIKALFFLPERWRLPSKTPSGYRANPRIPIKAYKALFGMQKAIRQGGFEHLNLPTLILIDPKDELISLRRLKKYKQRFGLDNYHILELNPEEGASYHHLIVDEWSMGKGNWEAAMAVVGRFLGIGS